VKSYPKNILEVIAMIKSKFTKRAIATIKHDRYHHPHPLVQRKMEALWLKSNDLPHGLICKLTDISEKTLTRYLTEYNEGGVEKTQEIRFRRPKSQLTEHEGTIKEYFMKNPPATIKEAAFRMKEITGIERGLTQVGKYLKSIGMKLRKVALIPAKADAEKQMAFKKKNLEPRLKEAKHGKRALYFIDASHFVYAAFIGSLWCFARLFIKSPAGRQRFNVLGAIDPITLNIVTVMNTTYVNALTVCELMQKIAILHKDLPVTLVLDNARYQRCKLVIAEAQKLGIELLFLPPYSPNLNLIERVWKFVKRKCLYSKYHENFDLFKSAIVDCLSNRKSYKEELETLITTNFQTF
jgi:transposase